MPYQIFRDCIVRQNEYSVLLDYVYSRHQIYDEEVTLDEIKKAYEEYIRRIYEEVKEDL